jgi:hypothetical protein
VAVFTPVVFANLAALLELQVQALMVVTQATFV